VSAPAVTVATAGLLDVQVTVVGAGPAAPFESVVDNVNPASSVCPASNIVGSGTVAFAGEMAIDVTVAALIVRVAVVSVGAAGSVQIVGSAAEIVVPTFAVPASVAEPLAYVKFAVKLLPAFTDATVTTAPLKNVLVGNPESHTISPAGGGVVVEKVATFAAIDQAVIADVGAPVNTAIPVIFGAVPSE
jgi:hypothetical protein